MKTKLVLLLSLCGCRSAAAPSDTAAPEPVVASEAAPPACSSSPSCAWSRGRIERLLVLVLQEQGGWEASKYPATDTPTFALYDDGLVLFVEGTGEDARVRQAQLSATEVDTLVRDAQQRLSSVPDEIAGSTATDQPLVLISVATRGPSRTVSAWGIDREGHATEKGGSIPAAFVELYRSLQEFRHRDAEPWTPDEIAIRLHPRDDADTAAAWPDAVPLPPDRGAGSQPLIYRVDGELEDDVLDALAGLGEIPTVRWAGRAWVIHVSRVVPG